MTDTITIRSGQKPSDRYREGIMQVDRQLQFVSYKEDKNRLLILRADLQRSLDYERSKELP